MSNIYKALQERILILDGAMGTMLQAYKFTEEDFRGERFKNYPTPLQGNNDLLSITQPEAIKTIHGKYFEVGADIIETNTFSGTTIAMADYQMEDLVYELNYQSAKIAKEVADEVSTCLSTWPGCLVCLRRGVSVFIYVAWILMPSCLPGWRGE